ncbi:C40 family peptidase [Kitasatospora camelliae]|uniref:NlpC/P60 family protein n=1 Tax=Kitasatospora camelliae TaxID=3156397 RepID=A0AAU8JX07_9ACTN
MPRRLLPILLLALTATLGLLPTAAAAPAPHHPAQPPHHPAHPADDPYPSTGDIARAQAEADAKAADTAAIETLLTTAQAELDAAGHAAEQAVEAYNGAQAHLLRARAEATAAAQRSTTAEAARAEAAERAARLAAETYRQGGASPALSAIDALLGARSPRALSDRAAAIGVAASRTRQILDDATSTAAEADRTARVARTAEDQARHAADAVRTAKEQAEARLADQRAQVTAVTARREQLLAELAAARNTTVDLERRRRQALEEIAARQAEEAAKAAAAAAEAARNTPPAALRTAGSPQGAEAAIAFARTTIGLPYIWGGEGPDGYDCSGLTMLAWRQGGRNLTHFAADQYAESTPIGYGQLRPGDLVFWTDTGRAADIHHVALYIGDDQIIEAPRPGTAVKQASLWIMGTPDFYARP